MANQNKKTNVRKGKQGFQKTTPVADHPKQLRHAPATPGNLTSGVAPTTYIPTALSCPPSANTATK